MRPHSPTPSPSLVSSHKQTIPGSSAAPTPWRPPAAAPCAAEPSPPPLRPHCWTSSCGPAAPPRAHTTRPQLSRRRGGGGRAAAGASRFCPRSTPRARTRHQARVRARRLCTWVRVRACLCLCACVLFVRAARRKSGGAIKGGRKIHDAADISVCLYVNVHTHTHAHHTHLAASWAWPPSQSRCSARAAAPPEGSWPGSWRHRTAGGAASPACAGSAAPRASCPPRAAGACLRVHACVCVARVLER